MFISGYVNTENVFYCLYIDIYIYIYIYIYMYILVFRNFRPLLTFGARVCYVVSLKFSLNQPMSALEFRQFS